MTDPGVSLAVFCLYMGLLFLVAYRVDRKAAAGVSTQNRYVYSLSLAVYCTAWTYYGSVGLAASSGLLFLPMYLGPTLFAVLWWIVLRKLVRLKKIHRITSIADFISARYNKSHRIAAIVTIIALIGLTPYIALQLKAIKSTFLLITAPHPVEQLLDGVRASWIRDYIGPIVVALMIAFTIVLGVRRLDPTERHEGMMAALAVECAVKLAAALTAGFIVVYFMYDGFGDIFRRLEESRFRDLFGAQGRHPFPYATWAGYLILSTSAVLFLPRQFHVAVVENTDEKHILTAMWFFPLYMLLINIFVIPIAAAGLLDGYPIRAADTYTLRLFLDRGNHAVSLLVFIGGVSAAAGMIMISSVTMATMVSNHLLLPVVEYVERLGFLRRHLLRCRWVVVAAYVLTGYWFAETIGESYMLVNIGLISFAAALQFAPLILGGIFWRRGNERGAVLGLCAGFLIWCYTLLLPSFVKSGWLSASLLEEGPWGLSILKPESLLGISGLDPIAHCVLWTLLFNVGLYVAGSLFLRETEEEISLAEEFTNVTEPVKPLRATRPREAYIDLGAKRAEIEELVGRYFGPDEARALVDKCLVEMGIVNVNRISIVELVELQSAVERRLAGSIGSAAAFKALHRGIVFSRREAKELAEIYSEILAELKLTPNELKEKIDYHREKESLLIQQAKELEDKVQELENEIAERKRAQEALLESEERYRSLVETMNEGLEIEDENGVITYVNNSLCAMWGCPREEIIGRLASEFLDRTQRYMTQERQARLSRGEIVSFETTYGESEGKKTHAIVSSVPILGLRGRYKGSFAVITDISEIKMLEREKDNLISMFAHDMRSSLTGIHGLGLRLLGKSAEMGEEKRTQYLSIINKEAAKLESLVDDFLEFSRLRTGKLKLNFRAISLDKELIELHEAYQAKVAQTGIELKLQIDEALSIIEADVNRLRRVFTNLLDNALKFSKKGAVCISAHETEKEVIVRVSDEGIGIAPEELPFIFDLFHRTRSGEKKEGYGIGLATVKAIVEGHGGRVDVASIQGKGSVFSIYLPKERRKGED